MTTVISLIDLAASLPTRRQKRTWRRRCARASWSKNRCRLTAPLRVRGDIITAFAIRDTNGRLIVPPWERR